MKPLSACTTPRRLMVPMSRHFLPVLQAGPPAWLTTGLMKGSRRPLAVYLPSTVTGCSVSFSPAPLPAGLLPAKGAAAGGLLVGTPTGFGGALCPPATVETRFGLLAAFAPALLAGAWDADEDEAGFAGAATTPLDLPAPGVALPATR